MGISSESNYEYEVVALERGSDSLTVDKTLWKEAL